MTTRTDTFDIAEKLIEPDGQVQHEVLFDELLKHATEKECAELIHEAVSTGVLIEQPVMRYSLGERDGLPSETPERIKREQITYLAAMVSVFDGQERDCYCTGCFADFLDQIQEDSDDAPAGQDGPRRMH